LFFFLCFRQKKMQRPKTPAIYGDNDDFNFDDELFSKPAPVRPVTARPTTVATPAPRPATTAAINAKLIPKFKKIEISGYSDSDSDNQPKRPAIASAKPLAPIFKAKRPVSATGTAVTNATSASRPATPGKRGKSVVKDTIVLDPLTREELATTFDVYNEVVGRKPVPNATVAVPDVLTQGDLNKNLLADIEKMYSPIFWKDQLSQQLPLFVVDEDELKRETLGGKGAFDNPKGFALVQAMLERSKITPANNNPNNNNATIDRERVSMGEFRSNLVNLSKREVITRDYEESQLTSPSENENPCGNGNNCLCNEWFGFVLKEFITPNEMAMMNRNQTRLDVVKWCLLCIRKGVVFTQNLSKVVGFEQHMTCVIQPHSNMINTVGEYTHHYCIEPGEGITDPFVINFKEGYKYHSETGPNGVVRKWLTQDGYKRCTEEDIKELNFLLGTLRLEDENAKMD
jgi:hypothetical protein